MHDSKKENPNKPFQIKMEPSLRQRIDSAAGYLGMSTAAFFRMAAIEKMDKLTTS